MIGGEFIRAVCLKRDRVQNFDEYPFSVDAVRALDTIELHPCVTFFVGDNGTGKSTLIEAIAIAAGFNAEGGTKNFRFSTRYSSSNLHEYLRLVRGTRREQTGFFLRAESYFNLATEIEELDRIPCSAPKVMSSYGGTSLHQQSHGESFLALVENRFGDRGLYILDEPEAALSPSSQLVLLRQINTLVDRGSQFLIATHSPMLFAYPRAQIYELDSGPPRRTTLQETRHYQLLRGFLSDPVEYLNHLFRDEDL